MKNIVRLLASSLIAVAANSWSKEVDVTVVVEGVEFETGQINVFVFDTKENFLETPILAASQPVEGKKSLTFPLKIESGRYAINVYHDVNDDSKLNKNFMGVPKEPYGFSNDAKGKFGPPSFSDALIDIGPNSEIKTTLHSI